MKALYDDLLRQGHMDMALGLRMAWVLLENDFDLTEGISQSDLKGG
jgi:hypothetical protein